MRLFLQKKKYDYTEDYCNTFITLMMFRSYYVVN